MTKASTAILEGTPRTERAASPAEETPLRLVLQHRAPRNFRRHWQRGATRVAVLALSDITTFWVGYVLLVQMARVNSGHPWFEWMGDLLPKGVSSGWQYAIALVLALAISGAYGAGDHRRDTGRVLAGAVLAGLVSFYGLIWIDPSLLLIGRFVATVVVIGAALVLSRWLVDTMVRRIRPRIGAARAIIVARPDSTSSALKELLKDANELVPVAQIDLSPTSSPGSHEQLVELGGVIERHNAETVVLWGNLTRSEFAVAVDLALASGCRLLSGPRSESILGVEPRAVWVDGRNLVELTAPGLRAWQLVIKRCMDIVGSLLGLLVAAPVFVVLAACIRLESPGPIFFSQVRVGRAGKLFQIFKFRSMVEDAEQRRTILIDQSIYQHDLLFKVVNDPRITRFGRWLRRTSLDELPQLWNVLKGEMSLVGPRPPLPSEVALYEEHHYCRFDVKPGITGPWQVAGRNNVTEFDDVIRLERDYIQHWGLATDLRILAKTVPVVLRMDGAH